MHDMNTIMFKFESIYKSIGSIYDKKYYIKLDMMT